MQISGKRSTRRVNSFLRCLLIQIIRDQSLIFGSTMINCVRTVRASALVNGSMLYDRGSQWRSFGGETLYAAWLAR